ncbi:MAG: ATP-binding cassette domain-containing protein [Gammaproteobacteria bacterium]|nr:ATP-binding cassette domain-containing protein [Gammaproteobacteria bacterium]
MATLPTLASLARASGEVVACAGNLPVDLGDPDSVWFIDQGAVDLFVVERRDGVEETAPQHLLRAASGRLLPGISPLVGETTLGLVAKGLPDTVLLRIPVDRLTGIEPAELAEHVDTWLMDLSAMLARDVERPQPDALVEAGESTAAMVGTISSRRGVVWVSPPGEGLFLGLIPSADGGSGEDPPAEALPLTSDTWLSLVGKRDVSVRTSESLAVERRLLSALQSFHAVAFALERLNRSLAVVDQANLDRERATSRHLEEEGARRRLFNLYGLLEEDTASADVALRNILQVIGRYTGIEFRFPPARDSDDPADSLRGILDASGVRARRVRLAREDRWWVGDNGAMLAFRADDGRPVALLPGFLGRYREVDPATGRSSRVTAGRSETLGGTAWLLYRTMTSRAAGTRDLWRIAKEGLTPDLVRFVVAGLLGGLVLLLPALVLGFVADEIVPAGDPGPLMFVVAGLAAFGLFGALLHLLQGMALMSLEARVATRVEAAFWDRLLRLPAEFLRRHAAGDLAARGMAFQGIRDSVQGLVVNAVLSIVFLAPAFLVIFLYDPVLGGVTAAFGLLSLVVSVLLGLRQISPHGRVVGTVQALAGRLFQLINGVATLRVDGAEGSAFAVWARHYRSQKRAELQLGALQGHLQAFGTALPLLAGAVLLLAMTLPGRETVSVGGFLVIYTVFMVFQTAVARLGASFSAVAAALPAFRQIQPLLAAPLETGADGEPVDRLSGEIRFDHVSFRYDADGPLIVDDVSIEARPGELVAIAGESGAGKSTLFRLALGLAQPTTGAVYYDGRDLAHLNVNQVRRQIGAVPQQVQLHPQDLWDNIVGDHEGVTAQDAWQAARTAVIDTEIAAMPMGMMTPVGASASVTSGGENQRISIARALVRKPRILLLDEATNWLDNESQARIMHNLAALTSTRIVIAHRLSTLRQADRIYVMQAGRVVQTGSFDELAGIAGVFRDLMRRQLV